ncbi:glycoside hydrolase family 31 protein [Algoriphagus namhaensis]|uniref:Glycoside hydrolase family 31 protein n=1 Tax=Algoriphagus namhaensis TaxID=915353 RepID=A0ABV8AVT6_9BACT
MPTTDITLQERLQSARFSAFGAIDFWKENESGIEGATTTGKFKFTVYGSGLIRVQASRFSSFEENPYSVVTEPLTSGFEITEDSSSLQIQTSQLRLKIQKNNFQLTFLKLDGTVLNEDDSLATGWIGTEVNTYKKVQANEKFIGLGEKTGGLNRFGSAYTNWNTDYFAYGTGDDPLYMSIPFFIGTHAQGSYGIFLDNTHKSVFNFGASTRRFIYFGAEDGDMDYYFFHENSISEIISSYTHLTGRMEMPPKWALGFQQCRYSYYPDSEIYTVARTFRDKDMPADVIYLDIHHMEAYKVFTFDGEKFPDPKALIAHLKTQGFRVVVIMDPGIKTEKGYLPYDEGSEKGLFVSYPDGAEYEAQVWPGWCAFPDFTKKETRDWWVEKMQFYTDAGVDGFWTDMNEPASWGQFTPNLIEFDYEGQGASHRKARNIYGMQMARSAQEGSAFQNPKERPFVLTRAGFAGIQRHAAAWTGDNVASEEHMLAGVRLVNSLGLSGVSFAGYDVGGFAGEASKSLFARWMSIATFSPFFRAHSMINSNDAEPWAFGEEVEEISRNYMKLRYKLLPTLYSSFYSSSKNGQPISASLAVDYPQDERIYLSDFQNEYIFCDRFLVAPVESTKEIMKVYLPAGTWYSLYSDEKFEGRRTHFVECPLNYLPVFVKESSLFTCQSEVSHTAEQTDGVLSIHTYPGEQDCSFIHYEDDGLSLEYKKGAHSKRKLNYSAKTKTIELTEVDGEYSSDFDQLRIYFHDFKGKEVQVNGESVKVKSENFAFLGKLTEFDPLPETSHPFHEIQDLTFIEIPNSTKRITIQL